MAPNRRNGSPVQGSRTASVWIGAAPDSGRPHSNRRTRGAGRWARPRWEGSGPLGGAAAAQPGRHEVLTRLGPAAFFAGPPLPNPGTLRAKGHEPPHLVIRTATMPCRSLLGRGGQQRRVTSRTAGSTGVKMPDARHRPVQGRAREVSFSPTDAISHAPLLRCALLVCHWSKELYATGFAFCSGSSGEGVLSRHIMLGSPEKLRERHEPRA